MHVQPGNWRVSQNNPVYISIRVTMVLETNGCMPFLDMLVERCESGIIPPTYRKLTSTDL